MGNSFLNHVVKVAAVAPLLLCFVAENGAIAQSKRSVSGAVTTISADDINALPKSSRSVADALANLPTGVVDATNPQNNVFIRGVGETRIMFDLSRSSTNHGLTFNTNFSASGSVDDSNTSGQLGVTIYRSGDFGAVPLGDKEAPVEIGARMYVHFLDDSDTAHPIFDIHPTSGDDFGISRGCDFGINPYVGFQIPIGDTRHSLVPKIGVDFSHCDVSVYNDESGGGGELEYFEDTEWEVSPTVGLDVEACMEAFGPGFCVRFGASAVFHPSRDEVYRSGGGFDYDLTSGDDVEVRFMVGFSAPLN